VAGTPEPEVRKEHAGLWVDFTFPPANEGKTPGEKRVETQGQTPVKTPEQILELLKVNPRMTLAEVAGAIGKSVSAVERASAKLVRESRLRHVGPTKAGNWEIL
jgi:ATP-dependent DNA helicase RecG